MSNQPALPERDDVLELTGSQHQILYWRGAAAAIHDWRTCRGHRRIGRIARRLVEKGRDLGHRPDVILDAGLAGTS